ncbi:MAG TPA: PqqD family protein [Chloroflexia bacterium]|jgi:hypothetical protein
MSSTNTDNSTQGTHAPASYVVARRMGEEMVLINMRTNRIYRLNRTGARFYELLSSSPAPALPEIVRQLAGEFGVAEEVVAGEVAALLLRLQEEGLMQVGTGN